ncbi:MAG: cobalt-precorrin-5B (C(1))-methyltransferase, partial [Xenococcaceae cyanobacterium]
VGGDLDAIQAVLAANTADAAYQKLMQLQLAESVFAYLAEKISQKAVTYVRKYADVSLKIGTILFDRTPQIISRDATAKELELFFSNNPNC